MAAMVGHRLTLMTIGFLCSTISSGYATFYDEMDGCIGADCMDEIAMGGQMPLVPLPNVPMEEVEDGPETDVGRDMAVDHPEAINALKWFQHDAQRDNKYPGRLKIVEVLQFKVDVS